MSTRRALLIGCPTGALRGVEHDLEVMSSALAHRDFEITTLHGDAATRAGIIAAIEALTRASARGDGALLYFSGHGGLAHNPDYHADRGVEARLQFLVPTDIYESTDGDFRGILDVELARLLAALTRRTPNVSVILDCCHAARMFRGFTPRSLDHLWSVGLASHLQGLAARGLLRREFVEANPFAVRVVAAGASQPAFEYDNPAGARVGVLTEALARALEESRGHAITWDALARRVRALVRAVIPEQRAEVEGPVHRLLFSTEERVSTGTLTFALDRGVPYLRGGALLGVEPGDVFAVLSPSDRSGALAVVEIAEVDATRARVRVDAKSTDDALVDGLPAVPLRRARRRYAVRVVCEQTEMRATVETAINASRDLRISDTAPHEPTVATLTIQGDAIAVSTRDGRVWGPAPCTTASLELALENIQAIGHALDVRALETGVDRNQVPEREYQLGWGRVRNGICEPLKLSGASVFEGDAVYVRVENLSDAPLYVTVFDIGLSYRVTLLSAAEPTGVELRPRHVYVLGADGSGRIVGLPFHWPAAVSRETSRRESFMVFLGTAPLDLRALESPGLRAGPGLRPTLQRPGRASERKCMFRYAIEHIDFTAHPVRECRGDGPYELDERPDAAAIPRGAALDAEERSLKLLLDTFTVERDGVWQIDALALARQGDGRLIAVASTAVVSDVSSRSVLFRGRASTALHLALWISRVNGPQLALDRALQRAEWVRALGDDGVIQLDETCPCDPLALAERSASVFARARGLLLERRDDLRGVYRTQLLATGRFGLGRHPRRGCIHTGSARLAYRVLAARR
ncbi:MAG: caspase family protein [Myxococcales bacterium]|nr:caspase family protein [Myxococcales bacterium]